ncbi:hypothetical protein F0170_21985 [Pseudomonas sp. MAFF 730085]|uniref:Uncharacterized protein n=1 Tax=Pseudomonas kitaguniensis TaxID=2607908 RepID=A0A5N7JZ67_9PSED|nr:hypothetical protein [Pseudomonas kitaguniensis]MPQ86413.1 hypothetical protein [Pseudomonas kitaguniensis]
MHKKAAPSSGAASKVTHKSLTPRFFSGWSQTVAVTVLMRKGCPRKDIARKLEIAAETVKRIRKNLHSTPRINSRPALLLTSDQAHTR